MPRRVLAIVPGGIHGEESVEEIRGRGDSGGVEVRVVVPAVEANPLRHTLGDIDEPKRDAERHLEEALSLLRDRGVAVSGEVGDPDPVQAAQDALLEAPADEVLIFEHPQAQARWYENGLFERAQEAIQPPLRMVVVETGEGRPDHVVEIEEAGPGIVHPGEEKEIGSAYLPGLSRGDLAGMVAGIVGTIVTIVLAAAVASGPGPETGWKAVAIGIAIAVALVNMAHVVGLTLFESVRYRGGFAKFFRTLSLVVTPLAALANLLILLFT
jgi:hypothetical protein